MKRSVFITGVNGGIGRALAKCFHENNYHVIGTGRKSNADHCDQYFYCDLHQFVSDEKYRKEISAKLKSEIEQLDVLINNAAAQILSKFEDITVEDWQKTLNVNLTSPMLLAQLFFKTLSKNKGSIVNIASIHQSLTKKRFVSYATSKSAIIGMTKAMAVDLEGKILVNAISPAAISTEMLLAGFDGKDEALKQLADCHPVKRIGTPAEIAELALFLADKNTGFINGANFTIDGGISSVLHDL